MLIPCAEVRDPGALQPFGKFARIHLSIGDRLANWNAPPDNRGISDDWICRYGCWMVIITDGSYAADVCYLNFSGFAVGLAGYKVGSRVRNQKILSTTDCSGSALGSRSRIYCPRCLIFAKYFGYEYILRCHHNRVLCRISLNLILTNTFRQGMANLGPNLD